MYTIVMIIVSAVFVWLSVRMSGHRNKDIHHLDEDLVRKIVFIGEIPAMTLLLGGILVLLGIIADKVK